MENREKRNAQNCTSRQNNFLTANRVFFLIIDTLSFELSHGIETSLKEVCLPYSRLLNDNSKLKSDDFTQF